MTGITRYKPHRHELSAEQLQKAVAIAAEAESISAAQYASSNTLRERQQELIAAQQRLAKIEEQQQRNLYRRSATAAAGRILNGGAEPPPKDAEDLAMDRANQEVAELQQLVDVLTAQVQSLQADRDAALGFSSRVDLYVNGEERYRAIR